MTGNITEIFLGVKGGEEQRLRWRIPLCIVSAGATQRGLEKAQRKKETIGEGDRQ